MRQVRSIEKAAIVVKKDQNSSSGLTWPQKVQQQRAKTQLSVLKQKMDQRPFVEQHQPRLSTKAAAAPGQPQDRPSQKIAKAADLFVTGSRKMMQTDQPP